MLPLHVCITETKWYMSGCIRILLFFISYFIHLVFEYCWWTSIRMHFIHINGRSFIVKNKMIKCKVMDLHKRLPNLKESLAIGPFVAAILMQFIIRKLFSTDYYVDRLPVLSCFSICVSFRSSLDAFVNKRQKHLMYRWNMYSRLTVNENNKRWWCLNSQFESELLLAILVKQTVGCSSSSSSSIFRCVSHRYFECISINQLKWIIFVHCHMRCKFKLICELIKMLVHSRSTKAIAEPGQLVVGRRCCCCWVFHSNCNGFVDK